MTDFELPEIKDKTKFPKILTMDEYHKFVTFNLQHAFDKPEYLKQKKVRAVNVEFKL